MRIRAAFFSVALLASSLAAQKRTSSHIEKFRSPDGNLIAVISSNQVPDATRESRIEIRTHTGQLLVKHNYGSEDGEHGYGVTKAAWTPDSQFFVCSLESSGGHQPWHSPVQFFSAKRNNFFSLDDKLNDAVMNPQFEISPPDRVAFELWFRKQNKTVSLSYLSRRP